MVYKRQAITRNHDKPAHWRIYTTGRKYGMFVEHNGNTRIRHFDLQEIAWRQPQTSVMILLRLLTVVLWTKIAICIVRN